ncbi:MAG TPA: type I phosphomannose isomerase catalytic subunit [Spirochaetota bacterium]|nr:type I phosphomannose isomerase catalytic subunit [Spirochaetota bacterium]
MQNELYPLKFYPQYKEKIWGGSKLAELYQKNFFPLTNCGESWEISGVKDNISTATYGSLKNHDLRSLCKTYKGDLMGQAIYSRFREQFPLLIKFIDARGDLSIQVHPDDKLAGSRHNSPGKTEMWYILHAEQGARLISGFNRQLDRQSYLDYFNRGRLSDILNFEKVKAGDVFYIPAGRVHAIGRGIVLAEIQQTSDITYRIYDWDRRDEHGRSRQLHTDQALAAMDYKHYNSYKTHYKPLTDRNVLLQKTPYFTTCLTNAVHRVRRDYSQTDSFVILIAVSGKGLLQSDLGSESITAGETILLPAAARYMDIIPEPGLKLLETFIV